MKNLTAAKLFSRWRKAGVPTIVSSGEAYLLSGGLVGVLGDRETFFALARVATLTEQRQSAEGRRLAELRRSNAAGTHRKASKDRSNTERKIIEEEQR